jgi:hypothetical protein
LNEVCLDEWLPSSGRSPCDIWKCPSVCRRFMSWFSSAAMHTTCSNANGKGLLVFLFGVRKSGLQWCVAFALADCIMTTAFN